MTLEELFAEEYKSLKKENEELKSYIEGLRKDFDFENKVNSEFCSLLSSLKLQIHKSNFSEKKYIPIGIISIYEGDRFYDLLSEFAKEEEPKEDEK